MPHLGHAPGAVLREGGISRCGEQEPPGAVKPANAGAFSRFEPWEVFTSWNLFSTNKQLFVHSKK